MIDFIDRHRDVYGVEPICTMLPIASSTYYEAKRQACEPSRRSARRQSDVEIGGAIHQTWHANRCVYGARTVWRQLQRDQWQVARCTIERLVRDMGLRVSCGGGRRARPSPTRARPRPRIMCVETSRRMLGCARPTLGGGFHLRGDLARVCLRRLRDRHIRTSDRGLARFERAQHESCTRCARESHSGAPTRQRLDSTHRSGCSISVDAIQRATGGCRVAPLVGRVGSSYDNALAETVIGLLRPKSSAAARRGAILRRLNSPPWIGSTGSIINACSAPSATSRRLRRHYTSMPHCPSLPGRRDSNPRASGKTGTIHLVNVMLGNLKNAITGTYHAFKFATYAHRYLADFQYRLNHRYDLRRMLGQLIRHTSRSKRRTESRLRAAKFHG